MLVGFQFRFHPALQRMRELLERKAIGRPLHAEVFWGEYLPSWHPWEDWRSSYAAVRELGGGVHHTICHPFDYLRWLFGDAQVVRAALTTNGPLGLDVAEAADVLLRFRSDVTAHVRLDYWSRPQAHHVEITCTEGTIAWDFMTGELRVWSTASGTWVTTELPSVESRNDLFIDEARHFLDVVNGRARPICTLEDGHRDRQALRSHRTGCVSNLGDAFLRLLDEPGYRQGSGSVPPMDSPTTVDPAVAPGRRIRIDSRRRWFPDLRELLRYWQLIVLLGRRDITVRYRQTVLGTIWIFAGTLVTAGLFSFVFGRVADLPSGGVPYFAFSYAGLIAWNLFSNTLSSASTSLNSNSALIGKIYFPRLVLPLYTLASTLVTTVISFGVMAVILVAYGIAVTPQILLLPVWLTLAVVLAMGISLALTALSVTYRDVNYITPVLTSVLLYLSPVAYSIEAVPANLRNLILLNPLSTIVEGTRWSLLGTGSLTGWAIAYTVVLTVGALVGGLAVFARLESSFADVI